jgi:hypothetical protein
MLVVVVVLAQEMLEHTPVALVVLVVDLLVLLQARHLPLLQIPAVAGAVVVFLVQQ